MLRLWNAYVIGGDSGKREGAWAVFLAFFAGFVWASWNEAQGRTMTGTFGVLMIALPVSIAAVLTAHGLEHVTRKGLPARRDG